MGGVTLLLGLVVGASAAEPTPPNVVLVLVDAMRADHLGPYGYARPTTPNLDRFAGRSVVFERCLSQAGWTVPAVASLFTSADPQTHQVLRYNAAERVEADTLAPGHETLAEVFAGAGYQTASLKKSVVVDTNRGMNQGFAVARIIGGDMAEGRSALELTDAALQWLDKERDPARPFFLYLHYMDPHSSYRAPAPVYDRWLGEAPGVLTGDHMEIERRFVKGHEKASAAEVARLLALYDAEIAYWDAEFGRLMRSLVVSGLDENTIVAVVADHGEAFAEHGQWFHGHVWQENLAIPFVVKAPGVAAARLGHWTQLIDVGPTLVSLAGIAPPGRWQGRSQAPVMRGGSAPEGSVYGEYAGYRVLIRPDGMKLMLGEGEPKLFNLAVDPGEKRDLAPVRGAVVDRMKAELEERFRAAKAAGADLDRPPPEALTPEAIEALRALGYVE